MEDFVSYDIAVKLKEKGFDWTCMAHFNTITYNEPTLNYNVTVDDIRGSNFKSLNKLDSFIDAPTISQVLKWLREEKKIHVQIEMCGKCYTCSLYERKWFDSCLVCRFNDGYKSYEQAAIVGIEYVMENFI